MTLVLSEEDIRRVLPMRDLIPAMERALVAFSTGKVQQPVRTVLEVGQGKSFFGLMPAEIAGGPVGAKLVTVFNSNAARGLPTHLATILLLDPDTGALRAILDGRYITEARTAAVSAVSAKLLARQKPGALAILGSGVQARSHLEALREVRGFDEVRAWSPTRENLERFCAETGSVAAGSAREAVRDAGVIVLVTASTATVLENDWVSDGAHVISVGACRPTHREMDSKLVARGRLIVDSRAAALRESGDIVLAIAEGAIAASHIEAELGELPARRSDGEVTIFKSLGMAVEDLAAGQLAFERAEAEGLGRRISV